MRTLYPLLQKNETWAEKIRAHDPAFFDKLSNQQSPNYLWIGCSDSRVPATEIVDLMPGEIFVHRNVGNVVVHTDLNFLSVLQYAVEQLDVEHIIVCGHYGCGGVRAAMQDAKLGLIDNWLRNIRAVKQKHEMLLADISDEGERLRKLCELNVLEQLTNVCQTTVVEEAWARDQELYVHGWIYSVSDGLIRDLAVSVASLKELAEVRRDVLGADARE